MGNIKKLSFIKTLSESLKAQRSIINVIIGPRQVGKTTTIQMYLEDHFKNKYSYYSADAIFNGGYDWVQEIWYEATRLKKILVIDEIQKIENWAEIIKKFWDQAKREKKEIQLILLGSSSLHIQKGLTESLTGRFLLIPAYHWNYHESKEGYDLTFEDFLRFGGYPGSYEYRNTSYWNNYLKNSILQTVIEKDILLYQNIKSPALFRQAFEIVISYPAQEISYTKLLGQIQNKGNVELVKNYLKLYEGAFLIKVLEKFSSKKIKTKSSSPKILPLAPSLFYSTVLDEYNSEEKGRVFELIVGCVLVRTGLDLYYWREGNDEVDFILTLGKRIFAIEVKSGRKKNSNGLKKFCEQYKNAKAIIITPENYFQFEKETMKFLEC